MIEKFILSVLPLFVFAEWFGSDYKIEKIPFKQAIILKSSNKNYDDIIVQDFDRFQVVAVVRGKMRVI